MESHKRNNKNMNPLDAIYALAKREGFTRKDIMGLTAAYGIACESDFPTVKIGAAIVYKGTIIGTGSNSVKSDPMQMTYNRKYRYFHNIETTYPVHMDGIHAEMSAIKSVPYTIAKTINWSRAKMYVYRIAPGLRFGQGLARPCLACANAIADMGIKTVCYSTDGGFAKEAVL